MKSMSLSEELLHAKKMDIDRANKIINTFGFGHSKIMPIKWKDNGDYCILLDVGNSHMIWDGLQAFCVTADGEDCQLEEQLVIATLTLKQWVDKNHIPRWHHPNPNLASIAINHSHNMAHLEEVEERIGWVDNKIRVEGEELTEEELVLVLATIQVRIGLANEVCCRSRPLISLLGCRKLF